MSCCVLTTGSHSGFEEGTRAKNAVIFTWGIELCFINYFFYIEITVFADPLPHPLHGCITGSLLCRLEPLGIKVPLGQVDPAVIGSLVLQESMMSKAFQFSSVQLLSRV